MERYLCWLAGRREFLVERFVFACWVERILDGEILYSLGGEHCWWKEFCLLGEEICDSCCCFVVVDVV